MKKIVTKVIFILGFATQSIQSAPEQSQQEKNIETIRRFFDEKYNDPSVDAKKVYSSGLCAAC